tara:strand:+ start:264 stop:1238 length:975 start_codon:yes stop_codon:yes gene_type:complete
MTNVITIDQVGKPEVLKSKNIELAPLGKNEVLLENKAIGLNFIDTYHRSGLYPVELPSGLGLEASGIIKKIGKGVKDLTVGDRVAYASAPLGAYSSERNYPSEKIVKLPEEISFEIAASIMTKGLTSYYLLFKTYSVRAGQTILFHAAAGGVGQIFCQWANSIGCKVIGTVGSEDKINIAKKNGCAYVINYSKDNFVEKVMEYTNNVGVPVVYDGVGKNTFEGSIACLSTRGTLVSFGNSSGSVLDINVSKYIQPKGLYFTRPTMAHYLSKKDELIEASKKLFEQIKYGKIKIEIFKKYSLSEVVQAHKDLEARKIIGPAVLIP